MFSFIPLTLLAALLASPDSGDAPAAKPAVAAKGSPSTAAAQLEHAKQARRASFKTSGEERRKILESVIAEYQVVLDRFASEFGACAEAAFRIGELKRSLGDTAGAKDAFEKTSNMGKQAPRFAARALAELGHLARRTGDDAAAKAIYQRVMSEYPKNDVEGVKALTWIGKIEAKRGNAKEAREIWMSLADKFPSQPIAAVRAADLAALAALKNGDRSDAEAIVSATQARFSSDNEDQAWWSPEVEEALNRMRAPEKLAGNGSRGASKSAPTKSDDDGETDADDESDGR